MLIAFYFSRPRENAFNSLVSCCCGDLLSLWRNNSVHTIFVPWYHICPLDLLWFNSWDSSSYALYCVCYSLPEYMFMLIISKRHVYVTHLHKKVSVTPFRMRCKCQCFSLFPDVRCWALKSSTHNFGFSSFHNKCSRLWWVSSLWTAIENSCCVFFHRYSNLATTAMEIKVIILVGLNLLRTGELNGTTVMYRNTDS